jgi:S1-C subfamily serine protease
MFLKKSLLIFCIAISGFLPLYAAQLDELLPNERNTVDVFRKASPKVVYVHRMAFVNHSYKRQEVPAGTGSGIIWDAQGHVVTNFHVINGADKLAISIGNMTVPAKVIGAEPRKDIAVLAVTSPKALALLKSYVPFKMAHTHELLVGQKAIAIGNPFGLDHTLTVGVISALGRQVPGVGGLKIRDMVQTDAAINPGNSGGPLLDSAGRLIGMNSVIFSQSGSSAGIGFAVPADDISRIVTQIIKHGRVVLAGIGILPVKPSVAGRLGVDKGILISKILPHTPAAKAGLKITHRNTWGHMIKGDEIVALNGHDVANYGVLYNLLTDVNVGDQINLTLRRNGRRIKVAMRTIDIAAF